MSDKYENDFGTEKDSASEPMNAFDDTSKAGEKNGEQNGESHSHTETLDNSPSKKSRSAKRGIPVWLFVTAIALSALLAFGGTLTALGAAKRLPEILTLWGVLGEESSSNGDSEESEPGTVPDLHETNPEQILDKSEPNQSIYGSAGEDVFSVSTVARMVEDAVVVINAKIVVTPLFGQSTVQSSAGSGVVISEDGYILTCNHVVDGAKEVTVKLNSGETYNAALVGSDAASDLAVLKITPDEGKKLVYAQQGCSEDLVNGERVVAIGNPLGTLGGTVTTGIVSATEREIKISDGTVMTLIQTDAAINSGNSGGGLFNLDGQLIGIVNAKYSASGVEGLAFAIPIDSAYTVQLDLIQYGYVRGILDHGLELLEVTEDMLSYYHYRFGLTEAGVYVVDSEYSKELENADLIRSVNGTAIKTMDDFENVISTCKVGDELTVLVSRTVRIGLSEKTEELTVVLELREFVPDRLKDRLN